AVNGIDIRPWVGGFNTYHQEVIDPSSRLYAFDPDVIIFAVLARDVAPDLWARFAKVAPPDANAIIERVLAGYRNWIEVIRSRSAAPILVPSLEQPDITSPGILDAQDRHGQAACIRRINAGLLEIAQAHSGVYVLDYDALVARYGRRI